MKLFPLTKPQKSIWNMEQYFGGSIANITGSALFTDTPDASALQTALNKTVEQNDSLRIRIEMQNGIPMQYISAYTPREFETIAFRTKSEFVEWIEILAKTPFDLNSVLYEFFIVTINDKIGFVLHLHHLTADAWTLNLLTANIISNLKNECFNTNSYIDYLAEESAYEKSNRREKDKNYFLSSFDKCAEPIYLSDKQVKSAVSDRLSFVLTKTETTEIQAFCAESGISPYALFMNALAVYIYRIKGAREFYMGTSVLNRSGKREKNTAGMYINTVPVLFQFDEEKSSLKNLQNNANAIMGVFRHQKYQYSDLLKDIRENYNFNDRLYDVMLNYQNAVLPDGISSQWHFCGCQSESLIIHINDRERKEAFHLDYDYQTEVFSKSEIECLHRHFMNLITGLIKTSSKKLWKLKMLSDSEYQQVIYDFNDTEAEYPKDKCIHQLFEEQAARTPNATAIIFEDKEYTYRQINDMSNSIAHMLRQKGVARNDIVAIIARRSYKIIVAQLAILKAGGAYLPIDPNYPKERIGFMLGDAKCKTAFVLGTEITTIDNIYMEDEDIFFRNTSAVKSINIPDDLFCALHTSGSTGAPKGTLLTHQNVMNFAYGSKAVYENVETTLSTTSIVFDVYMQESVLSVCWGTKVVYLSDQELSNQLLFESTIEKYGNCYVFQTPTKLESYINNSETKDFLKHISSYVIGGEVFSKKLFNLICEHNNNTNILNIYGPTETTVCSTTSQLSKYKITNIYGPAETTAWSSIAILTSDDITIGTPIANTQIYILDKHMNPLPVGAVGELCISGDGVGRGYLNRPELTAEKFINNPFIYENRMYKTGDLARWREDGQIEYIGRMDNQVKIRGLRVELGEIETVIAAIAGIGQIAVVVKKDEHERQYICAYYVSSGDIGEKAMRTELLQKLPRYMMPHFFVRLDVFPTTSSGKTDRNALPAPDFSNVQSDTEYAAPITDEEKSITALIQSVLNIQRVGVNDDFFDLGGDSLKAIEFVSKAQYEGISFTLQDVFDHPTTALLLAHIAGDNRQTVKYDVDDFTAIHQLLRKNKADENFTHIRRSMGDILITGATGWLGAHVLDEFLKSEPGTAYCLVRGSDLTGSRNRLNATLEYYFNDKYTNCERIVAVCGDITENLTFDKPINTIIHCAANVKHYGSYKQSYDINVGGTKNVIELAKEKGARLLHISTASVSGNGFNNDLSFPPAVFDETKLYIGQPLDNVYIRSKFEAEIAVLQARLDGLDAAVIRVGNLSNRSADYLFQKNYQENATLTRMKAFVGLGLYPAQMTDFPLEFSPVDDTAKAIIKLAQYTSGEHSMYHAFNNKAIRFADLANALRDCGVKMESVTSGEFIQAVRNAGSEPERAYIYEAFIHDIGADGILLFQNNITLNSNFTESALKQAGFVWSDIDGEYLKGYINYFKNIKYWGVQSEKQKLSIVRN